MGFGGIVHVDKDGKHIDDDGIEKMRNLNENPDPKKENRGAKLNTLHRAEELLNKYSIEKIAEKIKRVKTKGRNFALVIVSEAVKTVDGKPLSYLINWTMMRINLPKPLNPGEKFVFNIVPEIFK